MKRRFDGEPKRRINRLKARFDVRDTQEDGRFSGWASTYNNVDSYETAMAPGCFARTIAEHRAAGTMPALLWQHWWDDIPGRILDLDGEREQGLWLEGALELATQRGRETHALIQPNPRPALNGLSIGFTVAEGGYDVRGNVIVFKDVDLWEVSLVTFPANETARIETVRAAGDIATIRDLERALREAGFSRTEARQVCANFAAKNDATATRDALAQASNPSADLAHLLAALRQ